MSPLSNTPNCVLFPWEKQIELSVGIATEVFRIGNRRMWLNHNICVEGCGLTTTYVRVFTAAKINHELIDLVYWKGNEFEMLQNWKNGFFSKFNKEVIKQTASRKHVLTLNGQVHCFSMQIVTNKCFLLNLEKKIGADPSCRFREKRKKHNFNSKKWRHRAEG